MNLVEMKWLPLVEVKPHEKGGQKSKATPPFWVTTFHVKDDSFWVEINHLLNIFEDFQQYHFNNDIYSSHQLLIYFFNDLDNYFINVRKKGDYHPMSWKSSFIMKYRDRGLPQMDNATMYVQYRYLLKNAFHKIVYFTYPQKYK